MFLVLALIAAAPTASAVPVITGGPVNAASYTLNGLPGSGIAQGSMFILFGSGLGPDELLEVGDFPIPTELGGTSVEVTVGGVTVDCLMFYTLERQVAAVLPSNTPLGDGVVRLTFNNETSISVPIQVVERRLGIFTRNQAGSGPGILENFIADTIPLPVNSILDAATPGQVVVLWGTGIGPVAGDEAGGPLPGDIPGLPIEIFVGGQQADVTYRGRSGCCAGVDQIVFTVPDGVQGCYVSVNVLIEGVMSNSTTMAIAPQSGPCSDQIHFDSADITQLQGGGSLTQAEITLLRIAAKLTIQGLGTVEGNVDLAEARFRRFNAADVLASQGIQTYPSLGSCSLQQFQYEDFIDSVFANRDPVPRQEMDAGPALSVMGPLGMKQLPQSPQAVGAYEAMLGGISFDGPPVPDFLDPGTYTIGNGAGGAEVGPFSTEVDLPGNLLWTNRDTLSNPIPRNQPLPITWGSADSATEFVYILGSSADPASGSGASFLCTVNAGLGSFNVPAYILSALPASGQAPEGRVGFLAVGKAPLRAGSSATIADVQIGYRYYRYGHLINTNYQ
jgi:uncharacterized protein (TIGR03437 family)